MMQPSNKINEKKLLPTEKMTRRRLRFALDDETNTPAQQSAASLPSALTPEICRELWYQPDEINDFKKETRSLVLDGNAKDGDALCGLERFSFERASYKRRVIRYVLLAQTKQKGAEFIRNIAEQLTAWARDIAEAQGFADFCQVYDPLESLLGSSCENYNDCFFSDDKRKMMDEPVPGAWCAGDRRVDGVFSDNKRKMPDEPISGAWCAGDRRVRPCMSSSTRAVTA
jgi:hypothetical protein